MPELHALSAVSVFIEDSRLSDMTAPQRPRVPRRALDGVLLLDKPLGLSSNDALIRAKRLYLAKKAGHTGTLDPLATGLLPLCFGEATKFSQDLLEADKTYEATMRLGIRTTTGDAEGEAIDTRDVTCDEAAVRAALPTFPRRDRAGSADVFGAQARRQAAVRIRARRADGGAGRASGDDSRARVARVRVAGRDVSRDVQQGHVCAHAGRGYRRSAGLRRASGRAAAHRRRRADARAIR